MPSIHLLLVTATDRVLVRVALGVDSAGYDDVGISRRRLPYWTRSSIATYVVPS